MISLFSLTPHTKSINSKINNAIERVIRSGNFILGREVEEFEKEFSKYIGVKYAVGVASGTDALKISIKTLNLNKYDEVLLPANVYPSAFGVSESGVKIRLIDVDPESFNIDPRLLEKNIQSKTKAVIIVHLYGHAADLSSIIKIAKKNNLFVIEDCSQAHGVEYEGRKAGSFGDIGCFSFYPTKPLGAYGDGGMIVSNNKEIFMMARMLRMYGEVERYKSTILGYNSRLDEIQAAILRVKLPLIDKMNNLRKTKADLYIKYLSDIKGITIPNNFRNNVYHLFPVRALYRQELREWLLKRGIMTGVHFPLSINMVKSFSELGYKEGDFPVSEKISKEIVSLPIYPEIKNTDIKYITNAIKSFYAKKKT